LRRVPPYFRILTMGVVAMSTGGIVALVVTNGIWVLLFVIRFIRGWRNPDTEAGMPGRHMGRRYIDDQFRRPRDESDLL
jgi:hypothetical protein